MLDSLRGLLPAPFGRRVIGALRTVLRGADPAPASRASAAADFRDTMPSVVHLPRESSASKTAGSDGRRA